MSENMSMASLKSYEKRLVKSKYRVLFNQSSFLVNKAKKRDIQVLNPVEEEGTMLQQPR